MPAKVLRLEKATLGTRSRGPVVKRGTPEEPRWSWGSLHLGVGRGAGAKDGSFRSEMNELHCPERLPRLCDFKVLV